MLYVCYRCGEIQLKINFDGRDNCVCVMAALNRPFSEQETVNINKRDRPKRHKGPRRRRSVRATFHLLLSRLYSV